VQLPRAGAVSFWPAVTAPRAEAPKRKGDSRVSVSLIMCTGGVRM
jgi:hypothetical protein